MSNAILSNLYLTKHSQPLNELKRKLALARNTERLGRGIRNQDNKRKCILSLYTCPPTGDFPLEDMLACTDQRYRLLQILSNIGDCEMASKETWIPELVNKLQLEDFCEFYKIITSNFIEESELEALSSWDEVSHFALRTACSRLFESLKWFVKQEVKLFNIRWHFLNTCQQDYFFGRNGITLNEVSSDERIRLFMKFRDMRLVNDLFKTRFERASKLLKTRTAYLHKGWVYFTADQAVYPLMSLYESHLNRSTRKAKVKYDYLEFDCRYSFFFRRISEEIKFSLDSFKSTLNSKVDIKELDDLSLTSYPLCMSILHYSLKKKNHLRNSGRFQYNLFLKGIGLCLYDSIKFWRDIFTKKMTLERFTQHYLYGIRHNYGKLGKQADYPPLNCSRIMDSSPGPLDRHGCPFQKANENEIYWHMKRYGLSELESNDVWSLVKRNVPQQACARVFELKHGVSSQEATSHPNIYYNKSQNILTKRQQIQEIQSENSKLETGPLHSETEKIQILLSEFVEEQRQNQKPSDNVRPQPNCLENKKCTTCSLNQIPFKTCHNNIKKLDW